MNVVVIDKIVDCKSPEYIVQVLKMRSTDFEIENAPEN